MGFKPNAENDWTRWVVSTTTTLVMVLRPDLEVVGFIAGALANAVVTKLLKRVINADRPDPHANSWRGPGMPSSHASSLFFFAAYLTRMALTGYAAVQSGPMSAAARTPSPDTTFAPFGGAVTLWTTAAERAQYFALFALLFDVYAVTAAAHRVTAQLHTAAQVVVGAVVGGTGGLVHCDVVMPLARRHFHFFDDVWWGWIVVSVLCVLIVGAITLERTIQRSIRERLCPSSKRDKSKSKPPATDADATAPKDQ